MNRPTRLPHALAATTLLVAAGTSGAAADSPRPWQPYEGAGGFTVPAGEACDFAITSETLSDRERFRVVETWPDGSTRREEWTGQLKVEYTNDASGSSVVRNLTGRGDFVYGRDGSWRLENVGGHFGAVVRTGGDPAPGLYVVSGSGFAVSQDAEGHRELHVDGNGVVENVCDTLAQE